MCVKIIFITCTVLCTADFFYLGYLQRALCRIFTQVDIKSLCAWSQSCYLPLAVIQLDTLVL